MFRKFKKIIKKLLITHDRDGAKMITLRKMYQKDNINSIKKAILKSRYEKLNYKNTSWISIDAKIGEGLCFPHGPRGIFISKGAKIGDNCVIFQHVTIGSKTTEGSKYLGSPIIGDDAYIGAGAVILGEIHIGNHVRIGANTTVVKDIPDNSTVVSGGGMRILENPLERDNTFHSFNQLNEIRKELK